MRIEVEMVQEEGRIFRATAVSYPDVSVTGRTEKEALGLLLEAVGKYLKTHTSRRCRGAARPWRRRARRARERGLPAPRSRDRRRARSLPRLPSPSDVLEDGEAPRRTRARPAAGGGAGRPVHASSTRRGPRRSPRARSSATATACRTAGSAATCCASRRRTAYLHALPLSGTWGGLCIPLATLEPRRHPRAHGDLRAAARAASHGAGAHTVWNAVDAMAIAMLEHPDLARRDRSRSGPAACGYRRRRARAVRGGRRAARRPPGVPAVRDDRGQRALSLPRPRRAGGARARRASGPPTASRRAWSTRRRDGTCPRTRRASCGSAGGW